MEKKNSEWMKKADVLCLCSDGTELCSGDNEGRTFVDLL